MALVCVCVCVCVVYCILEGCDACINGLMSVVSTQCQGGVAQRLHRQDTALAKPSLNFRVTAYSMRTHAWSMNILSHKHMHGVRAVAGECARGVCRAGYASVTAVH